MEEVRWRTSPEAMEPLRRSEEHTSELQSRLHLTRRPPRSTPFPATTLFRSLPAELDACAGGIVGDGGCEVEDITRGHGAVKEILGAYGAGGAVEGIRA